MNKHTPGPWIVSKLENENIIYPLNHPEENICEAVCNMGNARLIAAAPELLEACQIALITLQVVAAADPNNIAARLDIRRMKESISRAEGK